MLFITVRDIFALIILAAVGLAFLVIAAHDVLRRWYRALRRVFTRSHGRPRGEADGGHGPTASDGTDGIRGTPEGLESLSDSQIRKRMEDMGWKVKW